jgi:hypothetical protein
MQIIMKLTCRICKKFYPDNQVEDGVCKVCQLKDKKPVPKNPPPKKELVKKIEELGENYDEKFW